MRDINRIDKLLGLLEKFWKQYPDLRLGQILSNASDIDVFFFEDDKFIKWLEEEIEKYKLKFNNNEINFHVNKPFIFTNVDIEKFKKDSEDSRRIVKERFAKREELKNKK